MKQNDGAVKSTKSPPPDFEAVFRSGLFTRPHQECAYPAALPDVALDFLIELAELIQASSVVEFGSGRSTVALLRAGFPLTSVEDSGEWMQRTIDELSPEERARHTAWVRPLRVRRCGLVPVMDWAVDAELAERLAKASLILIDSPYHPPYRESTLRTALTHGANAVVLLDDTRIRTLARFCDQLKATNPALLHRRLSVGHGFDAFHRPPHTPLRFRSEAFEIMKGLRRFALERLRAMRK